ncbi:MAG: PA14 domain-containing protein [Caldilineaceae bacterium]
MALLLSLLPGALLAQDNGPVSAAQSDPAWQASYWNNLTLSGDPVLQRQDAEINFDWGVGSPDAAVPANRFSARWTRYILFDQAEYEFRISSDDGIRLYIDDQLLISKWFDHGLRTWTIRKALSAGHHLLRVEYYDNLGAAAAKVSWQKAAGPGAPSPDTVNWRGEYYNNRDLSGTPALVRDDATLNFNWYYDSPAPGQVSRDNFSVRWTRSLRFDPGNYRFRVTVDDGVRLFVNNAKIIEQWKDQPATTYEAIIYLPGGPIPLRVEYYEGGGESLINVTWERVSGNVNPTPTWTPIPSAGPTATPTPIAWSPGTISNPGQPFTPSQGDPAWNGEYFNNPDLAAPVTFTRGDGSIDFDWGNGSPGNGLNSDNFSVRWTRTIRFPQGRYRFRTETDDGVRLYIDGSLVIDQWREQGRTAYTAERDLSEGNHTIRMEYFERSGSAFAKLELFTVVTNRVGNIITCVPPQPKNYAWIWIYRLDGNNQWVKIGKGIGSINATGYLKIDGLPVDVGRFGEKGEPYRIEQVVNNKVVQSVGNYQAGEPIWLLRPEADNYTPWGCPR